MSHAETPELNRLVYFKDADTGDFWVLVDSVVHHLRTNVDQLQTDGETAHEEDRELVAAGLLGAAHVLGTIADQLALLPLHDDLDSDTE